MADVSGEQVLATILKHDTKTTSYKIALLRALNDLALAYPGLAPAAQPVAVPLARLAELWAAYYWPFMDAQFPLYQGARPQRGDMLRNDVSFRPALTQLRSEWQRTLRTAAEPADGFFLLTEMRTPHRRMRYPAALLRAYDHAIVALISALKMPIRYAGPEQWSILPVPAPRQQLPATVALPGTLATDLCVVVSPALWQTFHRLSLYIEALCIHEWSLFTERVSQAPAPPVTRGAVYALLTARPDNRRPLSWERNQVDILLHENVAFTCPWTQRVLTHPQQYDLDHLLPLAVYPVNELWNLVPVDRQFNQQVKRDRLPSAPRLATAQPLLAQAYAAYQRSASLQPVIREDARLRFTGLVPATAFPTWLAHQVVGFLEAVAQSRYVPRF